MKFYTSDLHLDHTNILKYENRPFKDVNEMNEALIANWNKKVTRNDEVYILGDFAFTDGKRASELVRRLNGRKYLIRGNHDRHFLQDKNFDPYQFTWVRDYATVKDNGKSLILFHYPIAVWDRQHYGAIHLYGHIHSNAPDHHPLVLELENAFNVGVDVWNYEPVTLDEILGSKK